jgi:uncharacterized protein YcbX
VALSGEIHDGGDDLDQVLLRAFGREVPLKEARCRDRAQDATAEEYWPDLAGLGYRDTVTEFALPAGTSFDVAVVHLLTTATIDRLRALYPQGRFEARRFRPNIVISTPEEGEGFVENDWVGRALVIGGNVRLAVTEPCQRCVMVTLPQGDLPKDSGILRTAAQHNGVNVGAYALVISGGTIRRGDAVELAAKGPHQEVVGTDAAGCPSGSRPRRGGPAGRTRSWRLPAPA